MLPIVALSRWGATAALALSVLSDTACAGAPHVSYVSEDTRTVQTLAADDVAAAACTVWGLECSSTLDQRGAVVVTLVSAPATFQVADASSVASKVAVAGQATRRLCGPRLWAVARPNVLAHELGHVLGLSHHPDPRNVMHRVAGTEVEPAQVRRVHFSARLLALCPGHDPITH